MGNIVCSIITKPIKDLAVKLHENEGYMCNLVSTWQTDNNTVEIPTVSQIKEYLNRDKQNNKEIFFATPVYLRRNFKSVETTPVVEIIKDHPHLSPNTIILTDYGNMSKEAMLAQIGNRAVRDKVARLARGKQDIYLFFLWRAMSDIQTPPQYNTEGYRSLSALAKLEAWVGKKPQQQPTTQPQQEGTYEVSTAGDRRFSALNAKLAPNTIVRGKNVGGLTIEQAYQSVFKESTKGQSPKKGSYLDINSYLGAFESGNPIKDVAPELLVLPQSLLSKMRDVTMGQGSFSKQDYEDFSYYMVYLPLWQEWARQNPALIQDLAKRSAGKVLHDKFATNSSVNQARALTEILGNNGNRSIDSTNIISATIAPYYKTSYDEYLAMSKEEQDAMRAAMISAAKRIANAIGIELDLSLTHSNIGGYAFEEGGSIIEPSYTFNFKNATPEKVRLFTALMGDLAFQSQESVITSWEISKEEADALGDKAAFKTTIPVKDVNIALQVIKNVGIKNFTLDKQSKQLSLLSYDMEDLNKLELFVQQSKDNIDGKSNTTGYQSFYDEEEARRNLYQEWIANRGQEAQQGELSSLIQEAIDSIDSKLTKAQRETRKKLADYYSWQRAHLNKSPNFKKDHKYLYDGHPIDHSVTELREILWPSNIKGDHAYATAIGNAVDAIVRDFFEGKHPETKSYPNMTEERRNSVIKDCEELKKEIQRRWGKKAKIITSEFILAGKIKFQGKDTTVAGTMDMLVIDERGDLHILDMKAKHNNIDEWDNRRDYTHQLNAYRQLIEAIMPKFEGRIKDLTLIWFKQKYPRQGVDATYITNEENDLVSVTDNNGAVNVPLANYNGWVTPSLLPEGVNDIRESLIDLRYQESLEDVRPLDSQWDAPAVPQSPPVVPTPAPLTRQERQQSQPSQDVDTLPKIGVENFNIDRSNERAKLISTFSAQQRAYRVEQIAKDFSETLDTMIEEAAQEANNAVSEHMANGEQEEARAALQNFNIYSANDAKARRELITVKGVNAVLSRLLDKYQSVSDTPIEKLRQEYGDRAEYIKSEYQKIVDNFMPLLQEVAVVLEGKEPVRFIFTNEEYNDGKGIKQRPGGYIDNDPSDGQDNDDQFGDDPEGKRATGNDGWSYQCKFIEAHQTLTKEVKRVLRNLARVDANGNPIKDDLGNIRTLPERYTYASLLTECASISEVSDFIVKNSDGTYSFPLLERMASVPQYAWVWQLIGELENDIRLASQFFRNFRKDAVSFWSEETVIERDPITGEITKEYTRRFSLNTITNEDSAMAALVRNYNNRMPPHTNCIYDSNGSLNQKNAKEGYDKVNELYRQIHTLDAVRIPEFIENMQDIVRRLGFSDGTISIERIMELNENGELGVNGIANLRKVLNAARNIFRAVQTNKVKNGELPENIQYVNYFSTDSFRRSGLSTIAQLGGIVSENDHVQIFRIGDNDYPTYSAPDYSTTLFKKLRNGDKRQQCLDTQFKPDSWFYDEETETWNNTWLEVIEGDTSKIENKNAKEAKEAETRDIIAHMDIQDIPVLDGVLYKDWTPGQIRISFIRKYFSAGYNANSKIQYGWYNFPIFSDSEMARFIRFIRYTGPDFKEKMTPLFRKVVKQELSRIKRVEDRREKRDENENVALEIANFDKTGDKFFFFPELNDYIVETVQEENGTIRKVTFLEKCRELKKKGDNDAIDALIDEVVCGKNGIMENSFRQFRDKCRSTPGLVTELTRDLADLGAINSADELDSALEEYFWNHHFATSQIIQITTTDLAYYKDDGGIDFQKRFKEVYAGGEKLNIYSKYGKETEKSLILSDQVITSTVYQDIRVSLNKAVEEGRLLPMDRDNILYKFRNVNVVDGQAFRSLKSMRSLLDMMGIWTDDMQKAFERFEKGEWDMSDFNIVWQTIKPYLFTNTLKSDGLGGKQRVPIQHKDSEFLLLSIYQLVAAATGKNNKLRAINQFMDDKNIDVILFESAVKVGGQGAVDVSYSKKALDDWIKDHPSQYAQIKQAALNSRLTQEREKKGRDLSQKEIEDITDKLNSSLYITIFKEGNDVLLDNDTITQEEYNERFEAIEPTYDEVYKELESAIVKENVIHENSYEDYSIQQPTPEHLFDVFDAVFGSQFRNLIISDLPEDIELTVQGVHLKGRQAVLDLYQSLITENLLEAFFVGKKSIMSTFKDIESLRDYLLQQVSGNTKYGRDLLDALEIREVINPVTKKKEKVFNIPLYCPMLTAKVQELILAKFKNAITKQKIHGGNAILASDFGFTKELHVLHDKTTGAVTGIECYLPAYSRKFYEPFLVEKTRNINGKKTTYYELDIDKMPEELRRAVGYRIPTEDKYSMVPLVIKGFLPQQNGSSIMLPAEITTMSGSDFDVDKLFLMLPNFEVQPYDVKKARDYFDLEMGETLKASTGDVILDALGLHGNSDYAIPTITIKDKNTGEEREVLDRKSEQYKEAFSAWFENNKQRFPLDRPIVTKVKYNADRGPEGNSKEARDNMIIDISYGILTHPSTAEKLQNPGSFDNVKAMARVSTILNDEDLLLKFCDEYKVSLDRAGSLLLKIARERGWKELDSFVQKNSPVKSVLSLDTFIFNHQQNMAGGALIGMYANNTTAQAKNQLISLAISSDTQLTINGRIIRSLTDAYNDNGTIRARISKNCAEFSAASVDNGKDPNLAALMQNTKTANIMGTMLRAGLSIEEASLLFAHPTIRKAIESDAIDSFSFNAILQDAKTDLAKLTGITFTESELLNEDFTSELLVNSVIDSYEKVDDIETLKKEGTKEEIEKAGSIQLTETRILALFSKFIEIADYMGELTRNTRADSPNGAIDITMAGAEIQRRSVELMHRKALMKDCPIHGLDNTINNGVLDISMSRKQMREALQGRSQPMLQAFYSLGIDIAEQLIGKYFTHSAPFMKRMLEFLHDNSRFGIMPKRYLNAFFNDAFKYYMATSTIFGDNYEEKRDYYLNKFPQEFVTIIKNNPDLANIGIIRKLMLNVKDGSIVLDKSSKMDRVTVETLMRDFDLLMYDSDNPNAQQLALDLFAYCFYRDGFTFGPNNFGRFFSSNFMLSLPSFIDTAREMLTNNRPEEFWDNFMEQFYMYYGVEDGVCNRIYKSKKHMVNPDGTISISNKQVFNEYSKTPKSYDYIQYVERLPNGILLKSLYKKVSEGASRTTYAKVPTIPVINGKRYNPNSSSDKIIEAYNQDRVRRAKEAEQRKKENNASQAAAIAASANRSARGATTSVVPSNLPKVTNPVQNSPMVDSSVLSTIEGIEGTRSQQDAPPTSLINEIAATEREFENAPQLDEPMLPPDDIIAMVIARDNEVLAGNYQDELSDNASSFLQNFNDSDAEIDNPLCKVK